MRLPLALLCFLVSLAGALAPSLVHAQVFYFVKVQNTPRPNTGYLDVTNGDPRAGNRLQLWDLVGGDNQQWAVNFGPGGTEFYLQSKLGRYMDVEGGNPQTGTPVQLWDFNGSPAQTWYAESSGASGYRLRSALGAYLAPLWANSARGVPLWTWERADLFQNWRFLRGHVARPASIGVRCPRTFHPAGYRGYLEDAPEIKVTVDVNPSEDRRSLVADISFKAVAIPPGAGLLYWTHIYAEGHWSEVIYTLPGSLRIVDIAANSDKTSVAFTHTRMADYELIGCRDGDIHTMNLIEGPARTVRVIGDTGGLDFSSDDDCHCDTQLRGIDFRDIVLTVE